MKKQTLIAFLARTVFLDKAAANAKNPLLPDLAKKYFKSAVCEREPDGFRVWDVTKELGAGIAINRGSGDHIFFNLILD